MAFVVTVFLTNVVQAHDGHQQEPVDAPDWGIHSLQFHAKHGDVRVILPDDIVAGDLVSGSVTADPLGDSEQEQKRNLERLASYELSGATLQGDVTSGTLEIEVPINVEELELALVGPSDEEIDRADVPVAPNRPGAQRVRVRDSISWSPRFDTDDARFLLPRIAETGRPVVIAGSFNGSLADTEVELHRSGDSLALRKLAESPRKVIFQTTGSVEGPAELVVREEGVETTGPINFLVVALSAPKLDLGRGEQVVVTARIEGFQGLGPDLFPIPFRMINETPEVIGFIDQPGESVRRLIPQGAAEEGVVTFRATVRGHRDGRFGISAWVPWWLAPDRLDDLFRLEDLLERQDQENQSTCTVEIRTATFAEPPEDVFCPDCRSFRRMNRWVVFQAMPGEIGGAYRWVLKRPWKAGWVRLGNANQQKVNVFLKGVSRIAGDVEIGVIYANGPDECAAVHSFTVQQPRLVTYRGHLLLVKAGTVENLDELRDTNRALQKDWKQRRKAKRLDADEKEVEFPDALTEIDAEAVRDVGQDLGSGRLHIRRLRLLDQFRRPLSESVCNVRGINLAELAEERKLEKQRLKIDGDQKELETSSRGLNDGFWTGDFVEFQQQGDSKSPKEVHTLWRGLGCCLLYEELDWDGRSLEVPDDTGDQAVCDAFPL